MAKQIKGNRNAKLKQQKSKNNKSIKGKPRGKLNPKSKNVIKKRLSTSKVQDARQKIIQKKRKTVVDARDVLAKMAKTQDARNKLDKIRNSRGGSTVNNSNIKVIGNNILRKTDRNGKISLSTNKTKNNSNMSIAIKKQLGLITSPRAGVTKKAVPRRNTQIPRNPPPLRKTILNDMDYNEPVDAVSRMYGSNLYKWTKPDPRTASHMISSLESTKQAMRDVMREELLSNSAWPNYAAPKAMRLQPREYIDLDALDDEEMPLIAPARISLHGSTRISNVHSRLDSLPSHPESHGILSHTKTKVVVPAGHRIVVSNLQSTVTQDDIKELFEDIGQLLTARLVRPGVAEVIYKNLKDAQKAVDTYHNRQLDGQPMKCLLVNKRPVNHPTAPPFTKSEAATVQRKTTIVSANAANKLVPDISTIHKVLFQRK